MIRIDENRCKNLEFASRREWMLADGLGGYAMGTIAGMATRRYHGLLVAAKPGTLDRALLLGAVEAELEVDGSRFPLSTHQYCGAVHPEGYLYLESFELNAHSALWRYRMGKRRLSVEVAMRPGRNAVAITYRNESDQTVNVVARPLTACRSYHGNFVESADFPGSVEFANGSTVVCTKERSLTLGHPGAERTPVQGWYYRFEHTRESERGLDPRDDLYCPCELEYLLEPGQSARIVASSDGSTEFEDVDNEGSAATDVEAQLREAAEKFLVLVGDRQTIVAGYPWFTDWGRDTMIALPGLCLATGKVDAARRILRDAMSSLSQGMIPNRSVEDAPAEYNTVDATLWFVDACWKTLVARWDESLAREALEAGAEIFNWHVKGTRYQIGVDPNDGLLRQGEPGVQLTWMDAKIGDWTVTPRHGKPVEINALWINALRIWEALADRLGASSERYRLAAIKAEASFESTFWRDNLGYYLDTADPDDASLRPNQVIAMAVPFSPCDPAHAQRALDCCDAELVTPFGLRTLAHSDARFIGRYEGPLPKLDEAYHQGTVWPWLLGPYVDAVIRYRGDKPGAKRALSMVREALSDYGIGGIAEVYDGDQPQRPNGCPWQAWSVAEALRAWIKVSGVETPEEALENLASVEN